MTVGADAPTRRGGVCLNSRTGFDSSRARLRLNLRRHEAAFVVDHDDEARTRPPTGVGILVARMQGGDEDVWQAIFDDD
jgi:hypothetical protein